MVGWIIRIILLAALIGGGCYAYAHVQSERICYDTNRCEERIRGLNTELEFYSSEKVIAVEKQTHKTSARRAFYPADLDELKSAVKGSEQDTTCPVYGVPYRYVSLNGGASYFAYCPCQHRFHFNSQTFVNAITPVEINLHLFVQDGKVYNLEGGHPNPWDFHTPLQVPVNPDPPDPKNPTYAIVETHYPASLIEMLPQNPSPISRW